MIRRPPRSTRTATLFPYTTLFRSQSQREHLLWGIGGGVLAGCLLWSFLPGVIARAMPESWRWPERIAARTIGAASLWDAGARLRSEEHTSELPSLMRISYAVFCLKKKIAQHVEQNKISNKEKTPNNNTFQSKDQH